MKTQPKPVNPAEFQANPISLLATLLVAGLGSLACSQQIVPKTPSVPPPTPQVSREFVPARKTEGVVRVLQVLDWLGKYDRHGRNRQSQEVTFTLYERDINEYFAYALQTTPRPGIDRITVSILPDNNVSATIVMDFDSLREWKPELIPSLLRPLLTGKRTVQINEQFQAQDGLCTLVLKDARVLGGGAIPNRIMDSVLQLLAQHQPEAYDASRPIPLPFGLRRVWTKAQILAGET